MLNFAKNIDSMTCTEDLYTVTDTCVHVEARPATTSYDLAPGANKEKYVLIIAVYILFMLTALPYML